MILIEDASLGQVRDTLRLLPLHELNYTIMLDKYVLQHNAPFLSPSQSYMFAVMCFLSVLHLIHFFSTPRVSCNIYFFCTPRHAYLLMWKWYYNLHNIELFSWSCYYLHILDAFGGKPRERSKLNL